MMPGVIVQAHGISQLLEGRQHPRLGPAVTVAVILEFALLGMVIALRKRGLAFNLMACLTIIPLWWIGGMLGFRYGAPLVPLLAPTISFLLSIWITDNLVGGAERKQREFVQRAFSRYVSQAVVNQLIDNPEALSIKGERREATFIFTDIAGFTTLSESLDSDALAQVLNAYLDGACQIILKHEGTIDKFIGDAVMALFNAPIAQADHVERAVRCALELDAYYEDFRARQIAAGIPFGVTRIGVHTGAAVVGNFGSTQRMEFTALGDTVNTASRTEGASKYFGTRLCCTESVVRQCPGIAYRPIAEAVLKGKTERIALFTPVDDDSAKSDLHRDYCDAYARLKSGQPDAAARFAQLHQTHPDDPLVRFHHQRLQAGQRGIDVVMDDK